MTMKTNRTARTLIYLGTLPFVFALLIASYDYMNVSTYIDYNINFARFKSYAIAHSYGSIIVAFLAGIQWGVSLHQDDTKRYFIISNLLALLAWISLGAFASFTGISILLFCFLLALLIDRHAFHADIIPDWYWQLRKNVTLCVVVTLILLLIFNK